MSQAAIAAEVPWYRLLYRNQWSTLIAANLGWMFDGYETVALLISVGAALRQLLEAVAVRPDSRLRWNHRRTDAARLGDWWTDRRRARRLSRPQAHHDAGDPVVFAADRAQRICLGLGVVGGAAIPGRDRDRVRMGDRGVDRLRTVARSRPRPRRRADAMRLRDRVFPRLLRLVVGRRDGRGRMAHHVYHRRALLWRTCSPNRKSGDASSLPA
jgi:hypothetical protein